MKKFLSIIIICLSIISCSKDNVALELKEYSFDETNSQLMFQDGTAQSVMTSLDDRTYEIKNVIRVRAMDPFTIEIANFAPIAFKNVIILVNIKGVNSQLKLFKINKIDGHAIQQIKYSFIDGDANFKTLNNNDVIDLSEYKESGIPTEDIKFSFMGDGEVFKKLKRLDALSWEIKYHDYDTNNDLNNNWEEDISAKDIRRFSGLIINLGYVFTSNEFKQQFLDEEIIDNDGETILTQVEKEVLYQKLLDKTLFKCGKVVNFSGWGGWGTVNGNEYSILGFAEHILKDYLKIETGFITAHEFGHCLGYNHSSNMTYPIKVNGVNTGISPVTSRIMNLFFERNEFPISIDNYYMPDDLIRDSSTSKTVNNSDRGTCQDHVCHLPEVKRIQDTLR